MKQLITLLMLLMVLPLLAQAQYTGPAIEHSIMTVEETLDARVGTYAVVTGRIVNQLGENYYTFRDDTGEIRVEIEPNVWRNREVGPQTTVRLHVEIDSTIMGRRYLWVESLELVE